MNKTKSSIDNKCDMSAPSTLYPNKKGFYPHRHTDVGSVIPYNTPIEYNSDRQIVKLTVRNRGDRPIQVGSHFHFFEVNRYLEFDRRQAFGCHLNIPATTAIRFEPGDLKTVEVIAYAGKRRVIGFNSLVNGYTGNEDIPTYYPIRSRAFDNIRNSGFMTVQNATTEEITKHDNNIKTDK